MANAPSNQDPKPAASGSSPDSAGFSTSGKKEGSAKPTKPTKQSQAAKKLQQALEATKKKLSKKEMEKLQQQQIELEKLQAEALRAAEYREKLDKLRADFDVPAELGVFDPEMADQIANMKATVASHFREYSLLCNEQNSNGASIQQIYSAITRSVMASLGWAAACAQAVFIQSMLPKVECTYDSNGNLEKRKITTSTGNLTALSLFTEIRERELAMAEKLKPQGGGASLQLEDGKDPEMIAISGILQARLRQLMGGG
jgi:hypothetical protein